jgi:Flp pilus assembly protein TadG
MTEHDRGNALVEFAIASSAMLLLMFGIIDFGRALYTYHLVADGARSGARYAMVRGSTCTVSGCPTTPDAVQTYVRGLAPGIDPNQLTVKTSYAMSDGCVDPNQMGPGCVVIVTAQYTFNFMIIPLMPSFNLPMSSTSQVVISQ